MNQSEWNLQIVILEEEKHIISSFRRNLLKDSKHTCRSSFMHLCKVVLIKQLKLQQLAKLQHRSTVPGFIEIGQVLVRWVLSLVDGSLNGH
jgi:hypothetical protein